MMLSNDTVQQRIADRMLVGSMIQNLYCISYDGAKDILEALTERAADTSERPEVVPASVVKEILAMLPPLPAKKPKDKDYSYRTRNIGRAAVDYLDEHVT